MESRNLPDGKLPTDLLRRLLSQLDVDDSRVVVSGAVGEDAAVIERDDNYLVLAADPVTFAADRIGWYAVQINANDIAAMGATPQYFLSTILLPSGSATEEFVEQVMLEINRACRELGCLAVGGHTEVTAGIDRPIVSGAMVGEVDKAFLKTTSGAKEGEMIVLTQGIAIEATAILARERRESVREQFGDDFQEKAAGFLTAPGISVVKAGTRAARIDGVSAMHDVTEGGVATALWELAQASKVGLIVLESEIPRFWESSQLAKSFGFDLLGAVSSGALLMTVSEKNTKAVLDAMLEEDIPANVIGRVTSTQRGVKLRRGSEDIDLPLFTQDELVRIG